MFLGKERKVVVKEYRKPKKLELVDYFSWFFESFLGEDFVVEKGYAQINSIRSHGVFPHEFILGSNNFVEKRVFIPSKKGKGKNQYRCRVERYSNFTRNFFSVNYRRDNNVFCCGTNQNEIFIFQSDEPSINFTEGMKSSIKKPLRVIRNLYGKEKSNSVIKLVDFYGDHRLVYGNEMGWCRIISMLKSEILYERKFKDFVRAGSVVNDLVVVGSYSGEVNVIDPRLENPVLELMEKYPVESVRCGKESEENKLLVCCNKFLKVYDLRKIGDPLKVIALHKKTVTTFDHVNGKPNYFVSGGIDCCSKIFNLKQLKIEKQFTFNSPILLASIDRAQDFFCLTNNKKELIYCGKADQKKRVKIFKDEELLITENYKNLINLNLIKQINKMKNSTFKRNEIIQKKYKNEFHKFEYKKLLLNSIRNKEDPVIVVSIIQELKNRNQLINAIDSRNELQLHDILMFVYKNMDNQSYLSILMYLFNLVLQFYSKIIGNSKRIDNLLRLIRLKLNKMINDCLELTKLKGLIDLLLISSLK